MPAPSSQDEDVFQEGQRAGRRLYWAEVAALADRLRREHGDDDDELDQAVRREIADHAWIIAPGEALARILPFTNADNALFDSLGLRALDDLEDEDPAMEVYAQLAEAAMVEDVLGEIRGDEEDDDDGDDGGEDEGEDDDG